MVVIFLEQYFKEFKKINFFKIYYFKVISPPAWVFYERLYSV